MESPSLMKILEHMECPICTEIFNETDRKPKMLPCQHTICLECMKQIARRDETRLEYTGTNFEAVVVMKCPTCTAVHEAPKNDVDKFQNNITMLAFLSAVPKDASKASRRVATSQQQQQPRHDGVKQLLSETVQRLRDKIAESEERHAKKISSLEAMVDKAKMVIRTHCKEFKQAIELREAQLVAKLDDFNAKYQNVSANGEFLQEVEKMTTFCDGMDRQLKSSTERNAAKNLEKCLEMIEQVESLQDSDQGATNGNKWMAKFQPDRKDTVHASIAMYGQLILQEPGAAKTLKKKKKKGTERLVYSRNFLLGIQSNLIDSSSDLEKPPELVRFPNITESEGIGQKQLQIHKAMIENQPLTLNLINCMRRQHEEIATHVVPYEPFIHRPSYSPYEFEDATSSRDDVLRSPRRSPPDSRGSATLTYLRNAALADCDKEDDDWNPPRLFLGANPLLSESDSSGQNPAPLMYPPNPFFAALRRKTPGIPTPK